MKRLSITIAAFLGAFSLVPLTSAAFSDISASPYQQAINALAEQGILTGYPDGSFRPKDTLNRAELLAITYRATQRSTTPVSKRCFFDVPAESWYAPYVCDAKAEGIISGYASGSFAPDSNVNIASAAKIITHTHDLPIPRTTGSTWYRPYLQALTEGGALPSHTSNPAKLLTREEAAEILWRLQGGVTEHTTFDPLATVSWDIPKTAILDVPFSSQAPTGQWIPPFDEACEETSVLMVDAYLSDRTLTANSVKQELIDVTNWQTARGYGIDISAAQAGELASQYYGRKTAVYTDEDVTLENLQRLIAAGHPVIIPAAGQILNNSHYVYPGPPYHMIVLVGYNEKNFIAHDPGTQFGGNYPYSHNTIMNAIHDWAGSKKRALEGGRAMLVLGQ